MGPDSPWSAAQLLAGDHAGGREPALAVMGTTPHLVWNRGGILYHAYRKGASWQPPGQVAMGEQPVLVATPDGRLHCLFVNQFAGNLEIYHAVWDGREWSLPENVSHTGGSSGHPSVVADRDGSLHAAWADLTPGYAAVYYGAYDGEFWNSEPIPNSRGINPALAIGPDGDIFAAWQDRAEDAKPYDIYCASRQAGAWGLPELVSDSPNMQSIEPSAHVGMNGTCGVAWQEQQGQVYQVYYSQRVPGGWTEPSNLSAAEQDCVQPRLAAGPQGSAELVWLAGGVVQHRSRLAQADAHWLAADRVAAAGTAAVGELACAVGADGWLHLVWTALSVAGEWQLYYAQREPALKYHLYLPSVSAG